VRLIASFHRQRFQFLLAVCFELGLIPRGRHHTRGKIGVQGRPGWERIRQADSMNREDT